MTELPASFTVSTCPECGAHITRVQEVGRSIHTTDPTQNTTTFRMTCALGHNSEISAQSPQPQPLQGDAFTFPNPRGESL